MGFNGEVSSGTYLDNLAEIYCVARKIYCGDEENKPNPHCYWDSLIGAWSETDESLRSRMRDVLVPNTQSIAKLNEAVASLKDADSKVCSALRTLVVALTDKSTPLLDRYKVLDDTVLADHFKLVELEDVFDEEEVAEIESWEP